MSFTSPLDKNPHPTSVPSRHLRAVADPKPSLSDRASEKWNSLTTRGKIAAGAAGAVVAGSLLALGGEAVTNGTPPEAPAPIEADPASETTAGQTDTYRVQQGDSAWELAASRTPAGEDPATYPDRNNSLIDQINEQSQQDGQPGLHAYNPANGTGDTLQLPPALPADQDANPNTPSN